MGHFIIGIDSEYTQDRNDSDKNIALSYQWFCIHDGVEWGGIHYAIDGERISLIDWIRMAITSRPGRRTRWPDEVCIVFHHGVAELSIINDWDDWKSSLNLVQKSFASVGALPKTITDQSRNQHHVRVRLYDTVMLVGGPTPLSAIGETLEIPKISLPDGAIERMDKLLADDPELFERYAITDAEITARYFERYAGWWAEQGLDGMPPITIGAAAVRKLQQFIPTLDELMGYETVRTSSHNGRRGQRITRNRRQMIDEVARAFRTDAAEAFHGGRNECFLFGTHHGEFTDFDLTGAYPTCLSGVRQPDWDRAFSTTNPSDFSVDQMGVAFVEWEFPEGTRYPCLFTSDRDGDGRGLIFTRSGSGFVTGPEIAVARRAGARIEIKKGYVVPWKDNETAPFLDFVRFTVRERAKAKASGDQVLNLFWKLMGNSTYGKTAQGIRERTTLNLSTNENVRLPESSITCPFVASYVTGLCRSVIGEILMALPDDIVVLNAITDGICCTATMDQMLKAATGPAAQHFASLRVAMTDNPDEPFIEAKHSADGVIGMKTRMHIGLTGDMAAAVGIQLEKGVQGEDKAAQLKEMFLGREITSTVKARRMTSARELFDRGCDLVSKEREHSLSMDFDWKRRPSDPTTTDGHLAFGSAPWETFEEFKKYRGAYDKDRRPLKSVDDLEQFLWTVENPDRPRNDRSPLAQQIKIDRWYAANELGTLSPEELIDALIDFQDQYPGYDVPRPKAQDFRNDRRREIRAEVVQPTTTVSDWIEFRGSRITGTT